VRAGGIVGLAAAAGTLAIAYFKGRLVILDFMELRDAPIIWRAVFEGWLLVVSILIFAPAGSPLQGASTHELRCTERRSEGFEPRTTGRPGESRGSPGGACKIQDRCGVLARPRPHLPSVHLLRSDPNARVDS